MFAHTDVQVGAQDDYKVDLLKDANNHIYSLAIKAHDLPMSEEEAEELTYSKLNKICEQYEGTYAGNVYYNTSL